MTEFAVLAAVCWVGLCIQEQAPAAERGVRSRMRPAVFFRRRARFTQSAFLYQQTRGRASGAFSGERRLAEERYATRSNHADPLSMQLAVQLPERKWRD